MAEALRCLLALALLLSVTFSLADGDMNLVSNPSFEAGADAPDGWRVWQYEGETLTRDATVAHTGAASAHMSISARGASQYPTFAFFHRPVAAGEEYRGSAWVRTRNAHDIGGYLVIAYMRGDTRLSFSSSEFTRDGDHDWMRLEVRGVVPEGADNILLGLTGHGEGDIWFDDAELVRTLAPEPDPLHGDEVRLRLSADRPVGQTLLGFGAQADYFLTRPINSDRGVDDADRALVLQRVADMRPHLLRTFFDYKWWEPEEGRQTPDSEEMRDYVGWVRFLQTIGTSVLLCPWGDRFAYPEWMQPGLGRLPAPDKRDAMVRSLVDLVQFLREREGLRNVRYLCLMNEPDNDAARAIAPDEYVRLNRLLDKLLRERGLRDQVLLLTADESSSASAGTSLWFREILARGIDYADAWSSHSYVHQYVPALSGWIAERLSMLRQASPTKPKPLMITEFGYGGETYTNTENGKYEYGLFLADFATTALRGGASAALTWCLMDTYYSPDLEQQWGLWRYKDRGWEPRPGFYSWSLVTRYTRPGSQVLVADPEPRAHGLHTVALRSPDGKVTLLAVNRYQRPLTVRLDNALGRALILRVYRYTRGGIPVPGGAMISASTTLRLSPGAPTSLTLPAESFSLLTELR